MEVSYYVLDPTTNITVLAESKVDKALRMHVAAEIMKSEPAAEQVGFLSGLDCDVPRLDMAGGEFCGNATMSAAALICDRRKKCGKVQLQVSGAKKTVDVEVKKNTGGYICKVDMPEPKAVRTTELSGKTYPIVDFDGISHVIVEDMIDKAQAESVIKGWCNTLCVDALGIMQVDLDKGELTPLVYVPNIGTLCWEGSCASGTAAVGAYLATTLGEETEITLNEPGGSLTVFAEPDGRLTLCGTVKILKHSIWSDTNV